MKPKITWAKIDAASSGDNEIVAAVSGRKIRVVGLKLSVALDVTVNWKSGLAGGASDIIPAETFKEGGGMSDYWGPDGAMLETLSGEALNMYLGAAVQVSGWLNYLLV